MPYARRRLTRSERAARLRKAEDLRARGVDIVIPEEWRENCCAIEIVVAPPDQCLAWNGPNGQTYYSVYLQLCAKQSGLTYPEFDLRVAWDGGILLQTIELTKKKGVGFKPVVDFKQAFYFGGQRYWGEDILNPHVENRQRLPGREVIYGYLLATGTRRIPPEYRDSALVPFELILRDQLSGEITQTLKADLAAFPCHERKRRARIVQGGLYSGESLLPTPTEESRIPNQEVVSVQLSAPVTTEQRVDQIMEDAAIRRWEKQWDIMVRRDEKGWRRRQQETIFNPPFVSSPEYKKPSSIEPNPPVRGIEVDENLVAASVSDKSDLEVDDSFA